MTQLIRPSAVATSTATLTGNDAGTTNLHTYIDEITTDDATTYFYSNDLDSGTLSITYSGAQSPKDSSSVIVKIRHHESDSPTLSASAGNGTVVIDQIRILSDGGTQRGLYNSTTTTLSNSGALGWQTWTITVPVSGVVSWSSIVVEYRIVNNSGGSPGGRRGFAITWAELELTDSVNTKYILIT